MTLRSMYLLKKVLIDSRGKRNPAVKLIWFLKMFLFWLFRLLRKTEIQTVLIDRCFREPVFFCVIYQKKTLLECLRIVCGFFRNCNATLFLFSNCYNFHHYLLLSQTECLHWSYPIDNQNQVKSQNHFRNFQKLESFQIKNHFLTS